MKTYKLVVVLLVVFAASFAACQNFDADNKKFDNVVYLDVSKTTQVQPTLFSNNAPTVDKSLHATLTYPADRDVTVSFAVDPSLVGEYNARYGTQWPMLDAKYFSFPTTSVTIPVGKISSDAVTLHLQELMGQGEAQTGALPLDETYLVPVRITDASMLVLGGSSTAYYVVKRSSAITTAAQLTNNWISFASLDKASANSMVFNGLMAVTYEALIFIDDFAEKDAQDVPVKISSVMGVEQYLLLRIGDSGFERQQLQFDGSGAGSAFGKFPGKDVTKRLESGRWYHVACTYDQSTRIVRIYVNGKLQSEGLEMGVVAPSDKNKINLAMRALFDLWDKAEGGDKFKYANLGYDKLGTAYQFFVGYSYNEFRPLNGKIAEARVWSVARTSDQIWDNMYNVENPKGDATLLGYWKFNDGKGNVVKDYSQYGNDGMAQKDLIWPDGIEIPQVNKEKE
ncbi:MAG: DUF1735 and LamG domain-containing protein [Alistipes sp.]